MGEGGEMVNRATDQSVALHSRDKICTRAMFAQHIVGSFAVTNFAELDVLVSIKIWVLGTSSFKYQIGQH